MERDVKGHRIPAAGEAPPSGPPLEPPPPPKPATETAELLAHARALVAAIEEHIETRAEGSAGPLIEAAAENARQMVARVLAKEKGDGVGQSDAAFAEKLAADVLSAAAPFIVAAERERIRGILRNDPLIMADPVRIARLVQPDQVIHPGTAGITRHLPA